MKLYTKFILSCCAIGITNISFANPELYVGHNDISVSKSGNMLKITQQNDKAIIDWKSFDIDKSEITKFIQPSTNSIAINRVHSANASQILGKLEANGKIILTNPNGIIIGKDAHINAASFIATTSNLNNIDDISNIVLDQYSTNNDAQIINEGTITAADAGLVGLVSPRVINNGIIRANLGKVVLASADKFTVDLYGNNLFEFAIENSEAKQKIAHDGKIIANDGIINITAAAGRKIVDNIIEISGELKAPAITQIGNKIIIAAEGSNAVKNNIQQDKNLKQGVSIVKLLDALVDASSAEDIGGNVLITADHISLEGNTIIDVSAKNNSGNIYIGGGYQGKGTIPTSLNVNIGEHTILKANSIDNGNGGEVIVWSDANMFYNGFASAKGGAHSGNGGLVEISGKKFLDYKGHVDTSAVNGKNGTLLLDPDDIEIVTPGPNDSELVNGALNITGENRNTVTQISPSAINTASASNNVEITTDGKITIKENIDNLQQDITFTAAEMSFDNGVSIGPVNTSQPNILLNLTKPNNILSLSLTSSSGNSIISGGALTINSAGNVVFNNNNSLYSIINVAGNININANQFESVSNSAGNINNGSIFLTAFNGAILNINTINDLTITTQASGLFVGGFRGGINLVSSQGDININNPFSGNSGNGVIMDSAFGDTHIIAAQNINLNAERTTFGVNGFLLMKAENIIQSASAFTGSLSDGKTLAVISGNPLDSTSYINARTTIMPHQYGKICTDNCLSLYSGDITGDELALFAQKPTVTISGLTAATKEYDKNTNAIFTGSPTLDGIIFNDDLSISGTPTGTYNSADVGTYNIPVSGLSLGGSFATQYNLQDLNLTAAITKKPIDILVNSVNKEYDGNNFAHIPIQNYTSSLGDVLAVDIHAAEYPSEDVGNNLPVTITSSTFGTLSGAAAGNYIISSATATNSDITPYNINILGISADNKIYNGNKDATIQGLAQIQPLNDDDLAINGAGFGKFSSANVGKNIPVLVSGYNLSGSKAANYELNSNITADILHDHIPKNKDLTINAVINDLKIYERKNKDGESNQINNQKYKASNELYNRLYRKQLQLIELKLESEKKPDNKKLEKEIQKLKESIKETRKKIETSK